MGEFQRVLEVAEPVAAALDVEDVGAVEQAVEDGGGQDLVAGGSVRFGSGKNLGRYAARGVSETWGKRLACLGVTDLAEA